MLERHDATFHGEDLEMGYITHKLSGRNKLEGGQEGVDTNHRIALMKDCFVPTTVCVSRVVPSCLVILVCGCYRIDAWHLLQSEAH